MNELISVSYDNDRPTVLGRDLHAKLEVKTRYNDWFIRMAEFGFNENVDYIAITQKRVTAQGNETTYTDHQLTLDMAKQICMIQRSDLGKQYREYFLEIERRWNDPVTSMARSLVYANRQLATVTGQLEEANRKIEADRPKVLFADAVSAADTSILVGEMAKILTQNGVKDMGQNRFFAWLRDNGYLMKNGSSKNMPTQFSSEKGLFEIKESTKVDPNGSVRVMKTPKITGTGQQYFVELFLTKEGQTV